MAARPDGLTRGMSVEDTGQPISIPVGGDPRPHSHIVGGAVDKGPAIHTKKTTRSIGPRRVRGQSTQGRRCSRPDQGRGFVGPYTKGGKRDCSEERSRENVLIQELINNMAKQHGGISVFAGVGDGRARATTCINEMKESASSRRRRSSSAR